MVDFDTFDGYVGGAILLLFFSSVLTRAGFMLFGDRIRLPPSVRSALRYAPVTALIAIIVPDLLPWHAGSGPRFDYRLLAAIVAAIVYLRTRSAVLVIVTGMLVLWAVRWAAGV